MKIRVRTANNMWEVRKAYDLSARIFGSDYRESLKRKKHTLKIDSVKVPQDVIVALDKSKIIGMLRIVERRNYFLGHVLRSAGITNVCVLPSYQGKGIGKELVNASIEIIRGNNYPLSIVVARRAVDGFYAKYGYVGTGIFSELIIRSEDFVIPAFKKKIAFMREFSHKYLGQYAEMYMKTYRNVPLAFLRPREWWNNIREKAKYRVKESEFVNVLEDGKVVGYFIYKLGKIPEASCFPERNAQFCNAILKYASKANSSEIVIALSPQHSCVKYYSNNLSHTLSIRRVFAGGHMIRIINGNKIKKLLLRFIDKYCREFSRTERVGARTMISDIFRNCDTKMHNNVVQIILSLTGNKGNPVFEKIKDNILHTWGLLDEF